MISNSRKNVLHTSVLCIANYQNYTLAGIGNNLYVYQNQSLRLRIPIFINERVHKVYVFDNLILIKGGRQLGLIKLEKHLGEIKYSRISEIQCADWVLDATILLENTVGLLTAHNSFEIWDLNLRYCIDAFPFSERYILYSCKILKNSSKDVILFTGNAFGEILLWAPFCEKENYELQKFKGHDGVVFSIEVSLSNKVITTTSDDRSLRIWSINTTESLSCYEDWRNSKIELVHILYGHTARVWKSILVSNYYISVGEDSQLMIWRKNGTLLKALTLHQESGIRDLCFSDDSNTITTGGEDGGINKICWTSLISELTQITQKIFINGEKNFSFKVCFVKNGFVYMRNSACMLVNHSQESCIYKNEKFYNYSVLEVSSDSAYLFLGSIKGDIVIVNIDTKAVINDNKFFDGRVYSIHCLDNHVLICGPEGQLVFCKFLNGSFEFVKTLFLPPSKERWTTACLLYYQNLILGDRMGNLFIYDLNTVSEPVQCFTKIHSHLGVTDIKISKDLVLTIGRDGTLKTFNTNFFHISTFKLPIDWPWKIIKYKEDDLILGFHGVNFVVWSKNYREVIASQECGGGHRSCHFKLMGNKLKFLYVKEKTVFESELILNAVERLRNGFHSKNVNTLKIVHMNPTILATGSEDTTLRLSGVLNSDIDVLHIFKTHVSSVRIIAISPLEDRNVLIISAGGKAQIIVWKFYSRSLKCEELFNYRLNEKIKKLKSPIFVAEPDTRFMCLDILKQENEFIIASGCSDCKIRLFSFKNELNLLHTAKCSHCILNIFILKFNSKIYVASAGTNGEIIFWHLTETLNLVEVQKCLLHQSGINCCALREVENGNFILITGGDDNKICASLTQFSGKEVKLKKLWENSRTHSCQITGAKIFDNVLITTSVDQRITIWKWSFLKNTFSIRYLNQSITSVPDIQGMDANWYSDDKILLIVFGKGIDILDVEIPKI